MPYDIVPNHSGCPSNRPFAVTKQGGGKVFGCHGSRREARAQQKALYASEESSATKAFPEHGYLDINEMKDGRTQEINERFLVMAANIISNKNVTDKIGGLHALVDEYLERIDDWQAG